VAKLTVIPNHERLAKFDRVMNPLRSACVWNCPTRDEVLSVAKRPSGPFTLWYHGSLSPGQFPLTVIDALARLPDHVCLRFAGYETVGHVGYTHEILKRAEEAGVERRVEYVGTPPTRKELYTQAAMADAGLVLFARQFREPMAGASNKPFDYLACGLPVLVTDTPEWMDMYVRTGCGLAANPESAESIAGAVRTWLADPGSGSAMGACGRRRVASEWNYETQFEPVKRLLENL
jgi:glycosyltransferase involved in cell wall biosynthesis